MQTIKDKADLLISVVAVATHTPFAAFLSRQRGIAPHAFARQVAMYLLHTQFGYSQTKVGEVFGREKSTVGYAVNLIEDHRDDDTFDTWIAALEEALAHCMRADELSKTARLRRFMSQPSEKTELLSSLA